VPATATDVGAGHARGTAGYRRLVGAVWAAGVGSFTLLYAPQAVLPLISQDLDVSPSTAALTVSVTTATLAVSLLPMSYLADRVGRTRLMTVSLLVAAVLGLLAPLAPSIGLLLAVRAVQGVAIAGLPALAMAHVSEEVRPSAVGVAMGLFVAGNTVGGLSGRVLASTVADAGGWRAGLAAVGALALLCVLAFRVLLPQPTAGTAPAQPADALGHLGRHLRDPGVRRLCLSSFVLMAAFVTVYNYLGYRLLEEPFGLSPLLVGLVFITYLAGTTSAPVTEPAGGWSSWRGCCSPSLQPCSRWWRCSSPSWSGSSCSPLASSWRTRRPAGWSATGPGWGARRPRRCTSSPTTRAAAWAGGSAGSRSRAVDGRPWWCTWPAC
jgi:MFS transporter, YNFM family, putative membrane transport protein